MMRYGWRDYRAEDACTVERWMDDSARYFTGCDDGWDAYAAYMMHEDYVIPGKNFWCKIISDCDCPIAAAALYLAEDGTLYVSEMVVSPALRGQGHGAAILRELFSDTEMLLGCVIGGASAVIYPNNTASIRAFTHAGFHFSHAHPDGDALYYKYDIHKTDV